MAYDFDVVHERRQTDSVKWGAFGEALPLWVADMDFQSAPPIVEALRQRVDHQIFGYAFDSQRLRETIVQRLGTRYGWEVEEKQLLFVPNLVGALNVCVRAFTQPHETPLILTPQYPPFLTAPANMERGRQIHALPYTLNGQIMHYELDFDAIEASITPQTRLFMLCNPHNPIGRVFTRAELERLAEICLKHNLWVVADEIHCDLMLDGNQHIPFATLSPEIADRTITLYSPSKTYNVPTLGFAFAVAQNADMAARYNRAAAGIVSHPTAFGFTGAEAAYGHPESQAWVDALLPYLAANRDYIRDYAQQHFPQLRLTHPEGTYLSWMDWSAYQLGENAHKFFLKEAGVALNNGVDFDPENGAQFVRINFGCPRATLHTALEKMRAAVEKHQRA